MQRIALHVDILLDTRGSYDPEEIRGTIADVVGELLYRDFPRLVRCDVTLPPQESLCQSAT